MDILHKLDNIPSSLGRTVVSVGNFDGVHRAHAHVLCEIVRRAPVIGAKAIAVTFEPHPARILRPDSTLKLLTPTPEKLRLLEATGLDAVLLLPFGRDLSLLTPREFAEQILKQKLQAQEVHEGFNFHFGHKAAGTVEMLAQYGQEMGFKVVTYPEMRLRGEPVSSSHIRKLLGEGRVSRARHLLGRPFSILSTPGRGRGYGTKYTVPIESHLLNFHPIELTPETEVEIHFLERLRDEIKFPSIDALRDQIATDVKHARRYFHLLKLRSQPVEPAPQREDQLNCGEQNNQGSS